MFLLVQAANSFQHNTLQQKKNISGVTSVRICFDCSQSVLNAVVTAIYAREINVTEDNVINILALADFLQASSYCIASCLIY